jgi:RNA polymerase-binding transcription factor DksA
LLREQLEQSLHTGEVRLRELTEAAPDDALDPVSVVHRAMLRRLLGETEAALRRMDDGTYGACLVCDQTIPVERLELVPHAGCCVGCTQRLVRDG